MTFTKCREKVFSFFHKTSGKKLCGFHNARKEEKWKKMIDSWRTMEEEAGVKKDKNNAEQPQNDNKTLQLITYLSWNQGVKYGNRRCVFL